MRLDRLDLTRYGRFTDKSLTFPQVPAGAPDLHILYGPNEAGKSTLFSAWLDLLFGIPLQTKYAFLHGGPLLQLGARISHAGKTLELKRIKRRERSLLDQHDTPLPDHILQAALGDLGRDGYSAMFSLDDDTLERGGESILASKGNFGVSLFSGSAGLAGLVPQLEAIREKLDDFHKSKRSGWLVNAKNDLSALDARRKEIEISSSALKTLMRNCKSLEAVWAEARLKQEDAQARLDRLNHLLSTFPLRDRLAAAEERLEPLSHLPDVGEDAQLRFEHLQAQARDLGLRMAERKLRVTGLQEKLGALLSDTAILALSDAIVAAEAQRAAHDTAVDDLPNRREALDSLHAEIASLLARLGKPGQATAGLLLPPETMSALRHLLTTRSGLQIAAKTALTERSKAELLLARERERLGDFGVVTEEGALSALLSRLRSQDPTDVLSRSQRDHDEATGKLEAAIAALAPWHGDGETLAALALPPGWQIRAWDETLERARQQELDARRQSEDLRGQLSRLQSEIAAQDSAQSATGITLAEAAARRGQREALWSAHLGSLSEQSARRFEQALREDDRVSALLAEAMAEARRAALAEASQSSLKLRLEASDSSLAVAVSTQQTTQATIETAAAELGLDGASLGDLKDWLELRLTALASHAAQREARAAIARAQEGLRTAERALERALGREKTEEPLNFDGLLAEAVARLESSERRREARKRLTELSNDLAERRQAETEAQAQYDAWKSHWALASAGTLIAGYQSDSPDLNPSLDLLDALRETCHAAEELQDRIVKMERNRDLVVAARDGVCATLRLAPGTGWADVLSRLRTAQDVERDRKNLTGQIAEDHLSERDDQRALTACTARLHDLGQSFGWQEDLGALGAYLAECRTATELRATISGLQADLAALPDSAGDLSTAEARDGLPGKIRQLEAERPVLLEATQRHFEAYLKARQEIETVGGDDSLAQLGARRETLLLEIGDRTRDHLTRLFGLTAFEAGLRRYRDDHRSSMLARASQAFSLLSNAAYSGLAAQAEGAQEVLIARSAEGGTKLASELSKGTRFQLYLALRIAGYHEQALRRAPVPFIADDIMETFDDDRSAAAFGLLGEMSCIGQVIYLTHHRHLCDLARSVCPSANIIELHSI